MRYVLFLFVAVSIASCKSNNTCVDQSDPNCVAGDNGHTPTGDDVPVYIDGWVCPLDYISDDQCDCGCGGPDPDCDGLDSCSEPGCGAKECHACWNGSEGSIICDWAPEGWNCVGDAYEDRVCDCGCGIPDPDCNGAGCTDANCLDNSCGRCNNAAGEVIPCTGPIEGWTCDPFYYNTGYVNDCDCQCGIPDPDCGGEGCLEPGCYDAACNFCYDDAGEVRSCSPAPEGWTCRGDYYRDDECDCGCGLEDPGCAPPFCADSGNQVASCDDANACAVDEECVDPGCADVNCYDNFCQFCHIAGDEQQDCTTLGGTPEEPLEGN